MDQGWGGMDQGWISVAYQTGGFCGHAARAFRFAARSAASCVLWYPFPPQAWLEAYLIPRAYAAASFSFQISLVVFISLIYSIFPGLARAPVALGLSDSVNGKGNDGRA